MKHYVVGLIFNTQADRIVLVRKDRPEKLAGKISGPGGKVEAGETSLEAIQREIKEETGLVVPSRAFRHCATLRDDVSNVDIFRAFTPLALRACRQPGESEDILIWNVDDPRIQEQGLGDLPRLIQHARANRNNKIVLFMPTSVRLEA